MSEFIKEIFGLYKEKTKLPIVSTYIILLILWNWDILSIYLFASVNMETRIHWIKMMTPRWNHLFRIFVPALLAFLYPLIIKWLMDKNNKLTKDLDEELFKHNEDKRLHNAMLEFKVETQKTGKKDLETLRVEKETLRNKIEELTENLDNANKMHEDLKDEFSKTEDEKKQFEKDFNDTSKELNLLKNSNEENMSSNNIISEITRAKKFISRFSSVKLKKEIEDLLNPVGFVDLNISIDTGVEEILLENNYLIKKSENSIAKYYLTFEGAILYTMLLNNRFSSKYTIA